MADKPIKVKAYGKILNFPAGTTPEAIESAVAEHEPMLNPEYKAPEPEALDYAKGFASGANKLVSGVGFLAETLGADETGKAIREFGNRGAEYWNSKMSKGGKAAAKSQVFVDDDNEDSITGIKLSDDWGKALLMGASQSLPTMLASAIPGVAVTRSLQALASLGLAGGAGATIPLLAGTAAPVGVASNIIARIPSAVGFGAAEGVAAGAMNAADFKTSIESMPDDELNKSPVYRALKEDHGPEVARSMLAEQASTDLFGKTALTTGTIGALTGGGALGQAFQKTTAGAKSGILGTMAKGGASEALQEAPQSGGETFIQNLTTQNFLDPSQNLSEGVATSAASGAAIGGLMGGVIGGGSAVNITPDRRAQVLEEKRKIAEMKANAVNARQQEQGMADIGAAQNIDEAIAAASNVVAKPAANANDILREEDPTLADIEKLTGLKPTEAIDTAIDEINNPQPEEIENVNIQKTRQETTAKTPVLAPNEPIEKSPDGQALAGTGEPRRPEERQVVESPVQKVKDSGAKVETLTAGGIVSARKTNSDGSVWEAKYRTIKRSDGMFMVVRDREGINGPVTEHLNSNFDWVKGEPSAVVISMNKGRMAEGPELFTSHDKALENAMGVDETTIASTPASKKQAAELDLKNVEDTLVKGLQKTGKFTATDSKTYAKPFSEFYRVNAERQGILPSELYKRMPLKFNGTKSQRLSQDAKVTPASRNKVNFDLKDATPEDFTPDNVGSLLNKKNWAVITAANPAGKAQDDASNAKANEKLQKELAERGLAFEVVKGRYPGDTKEMESYLVYGLDQKAANELGNKYGQDSVLTREGLVHQSGKITPVKAIGKGKPDGYTKIPRTGARFAFDMDWDREASVGDGALSVVARHYSKAPRKALEGSRFGEGYKGEERERIAESDDPRLKSRVDFYVDTGEGVTPETGLGEHIHEKLLHNIYDASTNPKRFKFPSNWLGANTFEKQVLDAGYDGYFTRQGKQGRVVVLGDAAKSIPIEDNNAQSGESELLSQSEGADTSSRESDGSLQGLPRQVGQFNAALHKKAEKVARDYMKSAGLGYNPPNTYANVNVERAERIATAFDTMKHDPQNPEVKAAYAALVKETTAQYKAVVDSGLKVEFIDFAKTGDPYKGSPRAMTEDVRKNNHMWVFGTRDGFGSSDFDPADNPLLAETEFEISGQKALANDLFRVVHDYFGHVKEGVGFRAAGEENAWRAHMAMFSPEAGRALTTETRGQNSWVNYGPFAEFNKTASGADTKYADQKIGLLPEWASTEGRSDEEYNQSERLPTTIKQSGKKEAPERTLLAQHNISVKGLLHADKMGGLASPSLAIADKGKPLTGFGEITLIGDSNLTDPKQGAKVFGADIYSPRYPSVTLDFTRQSVDRLNEKLRPFIEASNSKDIGYYELGNAGGEREVTRLLQQEPAVLAALLTEKGVKPKYSEKPKVELKKEFKAFAGATDAQTLVSNPDFLKAVRQSHKDFMDEKESGDFTQTDKERFLRNLAYDEAYRVVAYSKYLKGKGKIDPDQSFRSLRLQVDAKNLGGELESYIHDLIGGMRPEEKIFKGFTNSGNRKYIPHTLENIVKELKKNLRGGETFNYGLGTVRSKYTPQFKSLDQIRREKGRLVSDEEFSTIRKEVDDKFSKLGGKLDQHHEAARFDTFAQAAYDAATMGLPRALKENGYTGVPPELIEETGDFLADLAHLPTEYFEVKLPRAVGLSEFSGAVVPKHTPESVINILKKNGITNIKKYKDAEDRKKQIGSFEDQFFQSNFYSALEKEIKNLKKIANKNGEVSVEQAKAWINSRQKEGKFKQAEVEAVGLNDWLDTLEGKVPVADVEEFVQQNGVQVEEVVLEGEGEADIDEDAIWDSARAEFEQDYDGLDEDLEDAWEVEEDRYRTAARERAANEGASSSGGTEFGDYVLRGGGAEYKELLLTLPNAKAKFNAPHFDKAQDDGAENIFAHTRINERYVDVPLSEEQLADYQEAKAKYETAKVEYNERVSELNKQAEPLLAEKKRTATEYDLLLRELSKETDKNIVELLRDPPKELVEAGKANERASSAVRELSEKLPKKPEEPRKPAGVKERVLFVEEIQSDWAQKGRDEGFKREGYDKEGKRKVYKDIMDRYASDVITAEQRDQEINAMEIDFGKTGNIPTAPFVTDTKAWTGLVAKRLLRYAAENGFDRIAWTAGAQQAERYRLSKQISEVLAERLAGGRYTIVAYDSDGNSVFGGTRKAEEIPGIVGRELAEKIVNQPEGEQTYTGLDLDVGGSGMKEFYDRIVPSVFNDISRKLGGGKVETISMGTQAGKVVTGLEGRIVITYPNGSYLKNRNTGVMTESQDRADRFDSKEEANKYLDKFESQNLHDVGRQMSLAITPALKEKVMQGLPLFQRDRAGYNPNTFTISLMEGSDMTSVIHEGGHFYLEALADMASRPDAPKQIVDDFDTTLQWFGLGDQVQDSTELVARTQGYPTAAGEPIATFRNADDIKAHSRYVEAKAGDDQAAFDLVNDLVAESELNQAKERFADATFVPVSLLDKDGANRIPTALAYHYANATGGSVSDSIFESKKAYHTGMNAMERLVSRANFSGEVEPGRRYVLVDDVTTVGSTLADLASYIQENGGKVIGSVLLANATRSGNMFANAKTLKRLEVQYGNEIRELFNIEPSALTNEEAQYLIGFRSADELRSSAIKAQGSRLSRIYARQVPERESSVEAKRRREVWQSMSLEQKRPHHEQWAQSFERYAMEGVSPTEEMQPVFERFKEWMLETYKSLKEFLKNNPLSGRLNNDVRQVFDRLLASESDIAATAAARGSLKQSGFKNLTVSGKSIGQLASAIARRYKAKKEGNSRGSYYYKLPDGRDLRVSDHEFPRKHGGGVANVDVVYSKEDDSVDVFLNKVKTGVVEKELSYRSLSLRGGDMGGLEGFGDDVNAWEEAITSAIDDAVFGRYSQGTKGPGTTPPAGATPAAKGPGTTPPAGATPAAKKPFNPNEDIPETRFRKAQRLSQDAFNRFTVIKEWLKKKGVTLSEKADVFQAEERYHSLVANQLEDFREHRRNPLIEKISKAGFTLDDVADFLEAQHAEEANRAIQDVRGDPTATAYGITDAEAKAYLAKADPKLAKLANELRDITEQSKQMRLKAGLISQDEVDAWEAVYQYYIPVKGDADAKGGTGKGLKVNFKSKRRLGHGRRDEAVIENIFMDHERAIMQVEKNRVAKHLVMMAAEMNMPEIVSIGQPVKRNTLRTKTAYEVQVNGITRSVFNNKQAADMFKQLLPSIDKSVQAGTISINPTSDSRVIAMASPMLAENEINAYIDGHAIRVQINDDLLARAYGKLGVTGFSALVSAGRAFNGYLSKVYTGYNPEFILTNMIRDFTSGLINLTGEEGGKIAAKAAANYVESFSSLMKYAISNGKKSDKWIDMYRANGGNTGAAYLSDLERLGDEIKTEYASYQGVLANLKSGDIANASRAAGRKVFNITLKWIYNLNQAGENAMRLAAFRAMIESGKTPNQAAKASKNITVNFNRKGELGAEANAAYLFFNASVQGTAALAHAHFKGKHKSQAWGLSATMGALGYLAAVALMGDDEDDYDKINDYTKSRNLLIKAGEGYVQIPVPYGYGFFWNTGRAIAEAQHKGELGVLPWHIAASAIEELTPFSDTVVGSQAGFHFDQVLLGMLPTVIKIPAQPAFNKQLFSGGELFPERASQQFQPDREKLWRSTQGTMYDRMAGWLSEANVGDVTPETLKHYTRTFTGGTGALVDATISAAMLKKEGAELEPSEIPFVRKAYSKLTIRENRAAYYKAREEAKKTAEAFSRAKTRNDVTTIDKLVKDEGEMLGLDAYANSLSEAIGAVRDLQDAIRVDDSLNAAEKRVKIKELEIDEQKFYDQYLDVFKIEKMNMKSRKD